MTRAYSQDDQEALLQAMSGYGDTETVARLLDGGTVQLNPSTREYTTHPLIHAVSRGLLDVTTLLVERGADVNAAVNSGDDCIHGRTPLMIAAAKNELAIMRLLLDHGAGINLQDVSGDTALHLATRSHQTGARELLIERGADETIVNSEGIAAGKDAIPIRLF